MGVSLVLKMLALFQSHLKMANMDVIPNVTTQIELCYLKDAILSEAAKYLNLSAGVVESPPS